MNKVVLSLAATAAAVATATPALANEGRAEARGGVIWGQGSSEAIVGVAFGYDFDLGESAFVGAEVSGDKILDGAANRVSFGGTGRIGARMGADDKIYANGGYTSKPCSTCVDALHAGAGWEHSFGALYGKVEYRHYFTSQGLPDSDAVAVGLGMKF